MLIPFRVKTKQRGCSLLAAALLLLLTSPCRGAGKLADKVEPLLKSHAGDVAVAIRNLKTGEEYRYRDQVPMPTASMIKFPVMIEAYRQAQQGKVNLRQLVTLTEEDKVPGSGILTSHFSGGTRLSLEDAIHLMIVYSDNTATNLVLDQIGLASTNKITRELGYPQTQIHAKVFHRDTSIAPQRSREFGLGSTTAADMIQLYEKLHRGNLASAEFTQAMLNHLKQCSDRNKLARLLPGGVDIAHKGGAVSKARGDAGIIFSRAGPIAICVLTNNNEDRRWNDDNRAETLCAQVGQIAFLHFNPVAAQTGQPVRDTLKSADSGRLVEDLQRTLNARLKPSPSLSVDGDFGPNTQKAVSRFQRLHKLPINGKVDSDTWKALGPLITPASPVPAPEVVNKQKLPKEPADTLDGVPFVTCKAWAIADAKTGKLLWGSNENKPLDMASTTKIMTAYLVLQLAHANPQVLDEKVVFSQQADETRGSTSGIRAGESLAVKELLYGLMLPSGNDASVAIAEHFGGRFAAGGSSSGKTTPFQQFIAQMNRTARQLGMTNTRFANPHGLTAKDHQTTASDFLRLAFKAMQLPRFREYVSTRRHGCTLTGRSGYQRNVVWTNTNRLLAIDGYLGLKTGTTSAAGACLVSSARRGERQLLMVVLGASSSDARYTDSRNLYRWAWQQLE